MHKQAILIYAEVQPVFVSFGNKGNKKYREISRLPSTPER